jgi:hypothetical protein
MDSAGSATAGAASSAVVLERRCRVLLRAYPPEYRAQRGEEILSTLLDSVPAGRRAPSFADAVDLVGNGLRRRWGLYGIAGLDAGLALAAPVALALAAGIAGFAWWRVEPASADVYSGQPFLGTFRTLGPIAYAVWLAASLGWVVLRPVPRRALIGLAVAVTLALPVIAPLTTVDRPPLWVLMALAVFGLLALAGAGSSQPALDARLAVPIGALGIAVGTSTVSTVASVEGAAGYYYQPTIARVGTVVTATVAILAAVAVVRQVRRKGSAAWLWAAALLGLPAGWLGPFEVGGVGAGSTAVPHFGRLAQVILATCVAAGTLAWLARRSSPGLPALRATGATALGAAAGLGVFIALGMAGGYGLTGTASNAVPWLAAVPIVALVVAGVVALVIVWPAHPVPGRRVLAVAGLAAAAAFAVAWLVGVYDNGWAVRGWADFARTASLVMTLALLPLSACAHVAARVMASGVRERRVALGTAVVLVVSLSWIGYAALPHLSAWGPMLLALALCWVAAALPGRGVS